MTAPAAKKTASKATKVAATPTPTFDFGAVTPEAAPAPTRSATIAPKDNPAVAWIRDSWANKGTPNISGTVYGAGKRIPIPNNEGVYKNAVALIRQACTHVGKDVGVKLGAAITPWDKVEPVPGQPGKVYVGFAAKTAKTVVRKPKTDAAK